MRSSRRVDSTTIGATPRDPAADESGVAALRHDRRAGVGAPGDDGGDLFGVGGPHDEQRVAVEPAGPVGRVRRGDVAVGQHVLGADDLAERSGEGVRGRWHVRNLRGVRSNEMFDRACVALPRATYTPSP